MYDWMFLSSFIFIIFVHILPPISIMIVQSEIWLQFFHLLCKRHSTNDNKEKQLFCFFDDSFRTFFNFSQLFLNFQNHVFNVLVYFLFIMFVIQLILSLYQLFPLIFFIFFFFQNFLTLTSHGGNNDDIIIIILLLY